MKRRLLKGTKIVVETCMGIKPHENLLVITDPPRRGIAEALVKAGRAMGADVVLMEMMERSRHGEEPPKPVRQAMCAADVILAPTTYSLTHTQARLQACEAGARVASMPAITEEIMGGGAMLADYVAIRELSEKIAKLLTNASEIKVETPAGTDLRLIVVDRIGQADTGIYHNPGEFGNLPAGEAFIAPVEGIGEGRVIIDGSIIGALGKRIKINVRDGRAISITGKSARKLRRMLDRVGPDAYHLAEFGIGTNPKARLIGNVLEDEKILGTCHIALGDNSTFGGKIRVGIHLDGVILRPTIKLDGKTIMEQGRFRF